VYRSLRHVYAQLVDDEAGRTLAAVSTLAPDLRGSLKHGGNKEAAVKVGEAIAKLAAAKGIRKVCFDRGGFRYHGVVAALAQAARGGGLEF
jgi:large subunit ribosomal protein L18